jgi:hypothetical protein
MHILDKVSHSHNTSRYLSQLASTTAAENDFQILAARSDRLLARVPNYVNADWIDATSEGTIDFMNNLKVWRPTTYDVEWGDILVECLCKWRHVVRRRTMGDAISIIKARRKVSMLRG